MGFNYRFYNPEKDFELLTEGSFVGMPFYDNNFPVKFPMVFGTTSGYGYSEIKFPDYYKCTGIIDRKMAEEAQKHMQENKNLFLDLMNKNGIDTLVFKIN